MQTYLSVLFSILFLNILPFGDKKRTRIILPISFLILWVFLAFRYNYGVDYINYNHLFYAPDTYDRSVESEPLFWWVMGLFEYYYQFIIFQTTVICLTIFYFVRKYIAPQYYWLFFIIFMCHTGMMFTITTAMRSGFAALTFIWGTELFYIKQKKPLLFILTIVISCLFHNSSVLLMLFPLSDYIMKRMSQKIWAIFVGIGFIISITSISSYVETLLSMLSDSNSLSSYSNYIGSKFGDSSFTIALTHLFLAIPGFYLFKYINEDKSISIEYKRISYLTLMFMLLHVIGIDFQNRLTVIFGLFYIISITTLIKATKRDTIIRYAIFGLVIFSTIWSTYVMFTILAIEQPEGSFWFYQTIFDAPQLP